MKFLTSIELMRGNERSMSNKNISEGSIRFHGKSLKRVQRGIMEGGGLNKIKRDVKCFLELQV